MKIDFNNNTLIITLYDPDDIGHIWSALEEIERYLCKKFSVDENSFNEYGEVYIDVDDYYEFLAYRRLILDYTPIY